MHFSSPFLFRTLQITLLFLFLSFQGVAQAPGFAWAQKAGGSGDDSGYGIAVDGSGNSYVTGQFNDTATFGNTTLISSGYNDVFIAKYDASGNVLWAQKAGGNALDGGKAISVDGSGNSYITGVFQGNVTFGSITLNSSGYNDVFIAKYDASGNVLWAQKAGGNTGIGKSIAVDGNGNSYVTGFFAGTATFGSSTLYSSSLDVFIAKYDASGNALWAHKAGGTDADSGYGIAVDSSGNSIITGFFKSSATFGNTTITCSGYNDVFIAKYDASGNLLWVQKAGGTNDDIVYGIAVDGSGNSIMTGFFSGSATFGSSTLSSSGNYDVFIAKYDASGNLLWAQKAGGTSSEGGNDIAIDGSGNSYVTGSFHGSTAFGSITLTSSGSYDGFIAKYDASGNLLWAQKNGGTDLDINFSIALDGTGNSYVTGHFQGSANYGITFTSNGSYDMFICKTGTTATGLPSEISAALPTYPNPFLTSFHLSLPGSGPATVVLTDVLGQEVHRQAVAAPAAESSVLISPAAHLPCGVYGLQIRQGGSVKQGKVVKQ